METDVLHISAFSRLPQVTIDFFVTFFGDVNTRVREDYLLPFPLRRPWLFILLGARQSTLSKSPVQYHDGGERPRFQTTRSRLFVKNSLLPGGIPTSG